MSLRLILVRHTKSGWNGEEDHARPLTRRGQTTAAAIGGWLAEKGYRPEAGLVSDAERTRETWDAIAAALDPAPPAWFLPELYLASRDTILGVLRSEGHGGPVLLLGHNPGLGDFASAIVGWRPVHPKFGSFPTGATAVIDFEDSEWCRIGWGQGRVVDFVVPRALLG